MPSSEETAAVVLAGGQSRRFEGGRKALATVDGRSLLERVVDVADAVTDYPTILAVATDDQRDAYADALDVPVRFVTDKPDEAGPLAGLGSAVEAAAAAWLLVLGCDMPLVERRAIVWLGARRVDADAVVPRTDDGIHPLHAWYRRDALTAALRSDQADGSLHGLLDRLSTTVVRAQEAPDAVPLERSVANVNTREDLAEARRVIGE